MSGSTIHDFCAKDASSPVAFATDNDAKVWGIIAPLAAVDPGADQCSLAYCFFCVFGITSNTLVRSSLGSYYSYMGRHSCAPSRPPTAAGWARLLDQAADMTAAHHLPGRAPSHCSDTPTRSPGHSGVINHMHMSHAPPQEPNRARIVWRN